MRSENNLRRRRIDKKKQVEVEIPPGRCEKHPRSRHVIRKDPTQKSISTFHEKRNERQEYLIAHQQGKIDKIQAQKKSLRANFFSIQNI